MIIVINEYTGMSADKPRKELIVSDSSELADIEAGHGSIAYSIGEAMLFVYDGDPEYEGWVDTEGNPAGGGGSGGGGGDDESV